VSGPSIEVAIPALAEHAEVLASSLPRLRKLLGASPLVVSPDPPALTPLAALGARLAADEDFAALARQRVAEQLPESKRQVAGWYYQQLLKYDIVLGAAAEQVLILDADTVLLGHVPRPGPGEVEMPSSSESHAAYFRTFERLTGLPRRLGRSAIVNFMWFDRSQLTGMLEHIEARSGTDWRRAILQASAADPEPGAFSEYETYANWCAHRMPDVRQVPIRLFRRGDLLVSARRSVESIARDAERRAYGAIAFEGPAHRTTIPRRLAARALFFGRLCMNFRRHA
jgi:hypothetical protein